jgi:hypothetical protein
MDEGRERTGLLGLREPVGVRRRKKVSEDVETPVCNSRKMRELMVFCCRWIILKGHKRRKKRRALMHLTSQKNG